MLPPLKFPWVSTALGKVLLPDPWQSNLLTSSLANVLETNTPANSHLPNELLGSVLGIQPPYFFTDHWPRYYDWHALNPVGDEVCPIISLTNT